MKLSVAIIALLVGSCATPQPETPQRPPIELAGRTAGPPERCVPIQPSMAMRISDTNRHVLIYGSGRTLWANNLGQCGFGSDDVLITEPIGPHYCRGDIVRSFDRFSRILGPSCVLSDFVPYRR